MSPNTHPVYEVAPVEGLPEGLPETNVVEEPVEQPAPKKNKALRRLAGAVLLIVSVLPFFLGINYIVGSELLSAPLLSIFPDLFASNETIFGVIPVLAKSPMAALGLYALILGLAIGIICALIAIVGGKSGALRVGTFFVSAPSLAYALAMFLCAEALDIIVLAIFVVSFALYTILAFKVRGKRTFGAIANLLCSIAVALALTLCDSKYFETFNAGVEAIGLADLSICIGWIVLGIALLSGLYAAIRMQTEKGRGFDLFRCVLMTILSALFLVIGILAGDGNMTYWFVAGAAVLLSLIQVIVLSNRIKKLKGNVEEPVEEFVEEVVEAVEEEFIREEYAEATPYEGGPVEGVAMAEEVNPTFTESDPLPEVRTAGYDFYNSKSFDPFIAILNTEERNQFTELFILKYKGVMPEIPDYEVGGDNKEFFRKLFIYLGQYRDRIPDGLLAKIYQFAIKIQ